MIGGIVPALIAAYDDHGEVCLERHAALLDHVLAQGVDGVFVGGSTGEAYLQSIEERKRILRATVEHVAGRASVIAHVGALDTRSTVELAAYANEVGVDAVSAVTPIYYEYDRTGYRRFFTEVAAATERPLVAYHIPGRTHAPLGADFFLELAGEGLIQALKYTATDLFPLAEIVRLAPPGFIVMNGSDEVFLGGLALGAAGGIGSTYNVIAPVYRRVMEAVRAGDLPEARRHQDVANRFIERMGRHDFLVFLREALRMQGVESGAGRAPLPVAEPGERERIRRAVDADAALAAALNPPSTGSDVAV